MHRFRHYLAFTVIWIALTLCTPVFLFAAAEELTQRDWMMTLVDTLGWSFGLPDEPQDPDYINILSGNRTYRFESENFFTSKKGNISIMSFRDFGSFSGKGWLHGARKTAEVRFNIHLPLHGLYTVKAHLREPGHKFNIAGTIQSVDGGSDFGLVTIGSFEFQAGLHEIIVTLPANGSIDYISFEAPNFPIISPSDGWQPDEPLTKEIIETTLLQLFKLADLFPEGQEPIQIEAEDHHLPGFHIDSRGHLGQPSGGKWLLATPFPASVTIPIELPEIGFYDLTLRVMGDTINVVLGGHLEFNFMARPFFDDFVFTSLYFYNARTDIKVSLPKDAGFDKLTLTKRQVEPKTVAVLLDLNLNDPPSNDDMIYLTSLLSSFGVSR